MILSKNFSSHMRGKLKDIGHKDTEAGSFVKRPADCSRNSKQLLSQDAQQFSPYSKSFPNANDIWIPHNEHFHRA